MVRTATMLYRARAATPAGARATKVVWACTELLIADEATRKLDGPPGRVADLFVACVEGGMRSLEMDGMEKC